MHRIAPYLFGILISIWGCGKKDTFRSKTEFSYCTEEFLMDSVFHEAMKSVHSTAPKFLIIYVKHIKSNRITKIGVDAGTISHLLYHDYLFALPHEKREDRKYQDKAYQYVLSQLPVIKKEHTVNLVSDELFEKTQRYFNLITYKGELDSIFTSYHYIDSILLIQRIRDSNSSLSYQHYKEIYRLNNKFIEEPYNKYGGPFLYELSKRGIVIGQNCEYGALEFRKHFAPGCSQQEI